MKKTGLHNDAMTNREDNFLSRWSRRKLESRELESLDGDRFDTQPEQTTDDAAITTSPGDEDMPPLESLDADSDYACFFSPNVSEALRTKALRILFSSPEFNVCDGLDDYDEDYTYFEKLGDIITADMRHQLDKIVDMEPEEPDLSDPVEPENKIEDPTPEPETIVQVDADGENVSIHEPDNTGIQEHETKHST